MSPRLPNLTPKQVHRTLLRAGFKEKRKIGSHIHLWHSNGRRTQVAMHSKDIKRGLLKAILRQAGMEEDEFRKLL